MEQFHRQRDILDPSQTRGVDIDLVGAGALGGAVAICVSKMGFGLLSTITITDFDRCAPHNLATQWFRQSDVLLELPKVEALAAMVAWVSEREVTAVEGRFTGAEERRLGPVVILAIDSLAERQRIWRRLRIRDDVKLLIDPRMGAQVFEVFAVDMSADDREAQAAYEQSLNLEEEPFREPCTHRAVLYTVLGGAAVVGSILRAFIREEPYPRHHVVDYKNFIQTNG